jgi:hypothetical protein
VSRAASSADGAREQERRADEYLFQIICTSVFSYGDSFSSSFFSYASPSSLFFFSCRKA